jgi:hypothetical protein
MSGDLLKTAIITELTISKVANSHDPMPCFQKSFESSGMLSSLESQKKTEQIAKQLVSESIKRGDIDLFLRLEKLSDYITEGGQGLGIFLTDVTIKDVVPILSFFSEEKGWKRVKLHLNAVIIVHNTKEPLVHDRIDLLIAECKIILTCRNNQNFCNQEIVARIKLLTLLKFKKDDALALVHRLFTRATKGEEEERFFMAITGMDLEEQTEHKNIAFVSSIPSMRAFKNGKKQIEKEDKEIIMSADNKKPKEKDLL